MNDRASTGKFVIPFSRHIYVRRRLLESLRGMASRHPLILLHAAPGSGRIGLLHTYLRWEPAATLWYNIAEEDQRADVFFGHLLQALGQESGKNGESGEAGSGAREPEVMAGALLERLERLAGSGLAVLVLFGVEAIRGRPWFAPLIELLRRELSDAVTVILVGTLPGSAGSFPRPAADVLAAMPNIGPRDFLYTPDEVYQVVREYHGMDLSATDVDEILQLTGGWEAGIDVATRARRTDPYRPLTRLLAAHVDGEVGQHARSLLDLLHRVCRPAGRSSWDLVRVAALAGQVDGELAAAVLDAGAEHELERLVSEPYRFLWYDHAGSWQLRQLYQATWLVFDHSERRDGRLAQRILRSLKASGRLDPGRYLASAGGPLSGRQLLEDIPLETLDDAKQLVNDRLLGPTCEIQETPITPVLIQRTFIDTPDPLQGTSVSQEQRMTITRALSWLEAVLDNGTVTLQPQVDSYLEYVRAVLLWLDNRPTEGEDAAVRALEAAPADDLAARARAQSLMARAFYQCRGDYHGAIRLLEGLAAEVRDSDDPAAQEQLPIILLALAHYRAFWGEEGTGEAVDEAQAWIEKLGQRHMLGHASLIRVMHHMTVNDFDAANRALRESYSTFASGPLFNALHYQLLSRLHAVDPGPADPLSAAQRSYSYHRQVQLNMARAMAETMLAAARLEAGDADVQQHLNWAEGWFQHHPNPFYMCRIDFLRTAMAVDLAADSPSGRMARVYLRQFVRRWEAPMRLRVMALEPALSAHVAHFAESVGIDLEHGDLQLPERAAPQAGESTRTQEGSDAGAEVWQRQVQPVAGGGDGEGGGAGAAAVAAEDDRSDAEEVDEPAELAEETAKRTAATAAAAEEEPATQTGSTTAVAEADEATETGVRARLFGNFEVTVDGRKIQPSDWRYRKVQNLFKYLLLHLGERVSAESIIEHFWPDMDLERARQNLVVALYTLRRTLEPELKQGTNSAYLIHRRGLCYLQSDAIWTDHGEFVACWRRAQQAARENDADDQRGSLARMLSLYRGHLLGENPYEDWVIEERRRTQDMYQECLTRLASLAFEREDYDRYLQLARTLLEEEPLREDVHAMIMRCYWEQGKRALALRQYQELKEMLDEQMGIEPVAETRELYEQILKAGDDEA